MKTRQTDGEHLKRASLGTASTLSWNSTGGERPPIRLPASIKAFLGSIIPRKDTPEQTPQERARVALDLLQKVNGYNRVAEHLRALIAACSNPFAQEAFEDCLAYVAKRIPVLDEEAELARAAVGCPEVRS